MPITPLRLADFYAAASAVGEKATLRFENDDVSIPKTEWGFFKVRVYDWVFRSPDEIAARKAATVFRFLDAVQAQHGPEMRDLVRSRINEDQPGLRKLSGRIVTEVQDLLSRHGGENWLSNEMLIQQVAYSDANYSSEHLSLSKILAPAQALIWSVKHAKMLAPEDITRLQESYMLGKTDFGKANIRIPRLSDHVARALRQAAVRKEADGIHIDRLDEEHAKIIADAAVHEFMTAEINSMIYSRLEADSPLAERLAEKAEAAGLAGDPAVVASHRVLDVLGELEKDAVRNSKELLTPQAMRATRDKNIGAFLTRHQTILQLIDDSMLAEGAFKDDFVKECLDSPWPMNAQYFERLRRVATKIETLMDRPSSKTDKEFMPAWLKLGETINAFFPDADPQAIETFVTLSVRLFIAQAFTEPLINANSWIVSRFSDSLAGERTWLSSNPKMAAAGATAARVFEHMKKIADYANELNDRRKARPAIGEFANRELAALLTQAKDKGLPNEVVERIQSKFLEVLGKNEESLWSALVWKERDGPKPPGVREQEWIALFGQQIAREAITAKVIQATNAEAYEIYARAHPFGLDVVKKEIAERERQVVLSATELLTPVALQALRDEHIREFLERISAPLKFEADTQNALLVNGADPDYLFVAQQGAALHGWLVEKAAAATSPDDKAAAIQAYRDTIETLIKTLPGDGSGELETFLALSMALFTDQNSPETVAALEALTKDEDTITG